MKRALYIWQQADWPDFKWDDARVAPLLNSVLERQSSSGDKLIRF